MDNGSWYNTTIFSQLNGQKFEDYLKTGQKDRYELMCAVDVYGKEHIPMLGYSSSGGGRTLENPPSKKHLYHLIRLSTLSIIGFNALNKMMIKV